MPKRYYSSCRNTNYQVYEIVCLMRLAGMRVERTGAQHFAVRLSHKGKWNTHEMTTRQILARYGKGTQAYALMRELPRAKEIPVAIPPKKRVYPPRKAKHMDLVE